MPPSNNGFSFEISLSVLNHLGRNLYRNFATILGEAISNAWDADAHNVWIYINESASTLIVKDDGIGMSHDDFQNKLLKIGYSKRKASNSSVSPAGRPFIGRKGIGKLALLSCAQRISIISKTTSTDFIGGTIDNSGLDDAIEDDLTPDQYPLESIDMSLFGTHGDDMSSGTIIHFAGLKDGIRNSVDHLRKIVALYFRFSLVDPTFTIYINDEKISIDNLQDLIDATEFLWEINELNDPLIDKLRTVCIEKNMLMGHPDLEGFIASVKKPRDLKVLGTDEKVGIDLFVNGRLREKDILKHIPTARITESYLYGQIHFNNLDDGEADRFTSSREGVVADDELFSQMLTTLRDTLLPAIFSDWDTWRGKHKKDGDPESPRLTKKSRKSEELFNAVADEYRDDVGDEHSRTVQGWVDSLSSDARFNFTSYAECFIAENLVREYITSNAIPLSAEARRDIAEWQRKEAQNKANGNISIEIRKNNTDLSYLDMAGLAFMVDDTPIGNGGLRDDSKQYRPVRDALMHTALLSDEAKRKLTSVYDNIRARVKTLLTTGGS